MRSYGQRCGLAKALDVVGDRWSLLIVRELMIRGACRYTDLKNGLPGVASNLLAERLRDLEADGVILREDAPPPVATGLYRLSPLGARLEPLVLQLGQWGAAFLGDVDPGDVMQAHWLVLPLRLHLADQAPAAAPVALEVRAGDEPIAVRAEGGVIDVRLGRAADAAAVVTGQPDLVLRLLTGRTGLAAARAAGLRYDGDEAALARVVRPAA